MRKFLVLTMIVLSCSVLSNETRSKGSIHITSKEKKDLNGGIELHLLPLYYDSTLGAGVEVVLDDKYVIFPNKNGVIRINLKNESCFKLNIFSLSSLVFENDSLCFDSNNVINGKIMLEW